MSKFYNLFHSKSTIQKKIISRRNFTYRVLLGLVDEHLDSGIKLLDIGCGAGTLGFYAASKGCCVVGVDVSSKVISTCKKSAAGLGLSDKVRFKTIDFPKKLPNGSYDLIFFIEVMEHLEDDDIAIAKIYKLLNRNGILILSTPSINAPLHRWGFAQKFDIKVGHLRRYDINMLSNMIEKKGFKIIKTKKTEGLLRNFLYYNSYAGKIIRFIKYFFSDVVTFIDNLLISIFGESNIVIVAKKI